MYLYVEKYRNICIPEGHKQNPGICLNLYATHIVAQLSHIATFACRLGKTPTTLPLGWGQRRGLLNIVIV